MIELLAAAACAIAIEAQQDAQLRLRPACPAAFAATHAAVGEARLKPARELDLAQGHPVPPERRLPYDAQLWIRLSR
jgi:hypothetical protein